MDFVNFFHEAAANVNPLTGEPILQAGDTVVVDNCPTHHSQPARGLRRWLGEHGIEMLFTPVYSPEFNPAEFCFNKLKHLVKSEELRSIFKK